METYDTTQAGSGLTGTAEPIILLINGSGLGVSLVIGFLILTGYMIGHEARK